MKNNDKGKSDFYDFSQDLMIDLSNKPHRFIDLKCLINQLTEIYNNVGNCKCAVLTDRELKFTYLYRDDPNEGISVDCLYPHKNSILGISTHHVFVPYEEIIHSDNIEAAAFKTDIKINHNYFGFTAIECIGDNGIKYDAVTKNDEIWIVFYTKPSHDINIKMNITYIIDQKAYPNDKVSGIEKERSMAIKILDVFENILDEKGIKIPDEDRTGNDSEASIFGTTYGDLENQITSILTNYFYK